MRTPRLTEALVALEQTIREVRFSENITTLQGLADTCQTVLRLIGSNSDVERAAMRLEDLRSAYVQLQNSVKSAQIGREKALLTQKLRNVGKKCEDVRDFSQLQRLYEEVSVGFWLASRDFQQPNKPFQDFICSLLSEKRGYKEANSQESALIDRIADLQREMRSKDVIIAMCRSEINKLSANIAPILGISLPFIEKYPELELPQLCQSLFEALSKGKKSLRRTYSDWGRTEIEGKRQEKAVKTQEMDIEELMFERDLARQQNAILRLGTKDSETTENTLFSRLQAKEHTIRLEIQQIAMEKAYIQSEKQAIFTEKQLLIPRKTSEVGTSTLASGLIPLKSASNHRLHASFSSRNLSPEAVSKAAEVLEKAHQHLDILERQWNSMSSRKLKDSKKERKVSISLVETEEEREIATKTEEKLEKIGGKKEEIAGKKREIEKGKSLFAAGRKGNALAWCRDWDSVRSGRNTQEIAKVPTPLLA